MANKPWYGSTHAEIEQHGYQFQQGADYYGPSIGFTVAQISRVDDAMSQLYNAKDFKIQAEQQLKQAQAEFLAAEKQVILAMQDLSKVVRAKNPGDTVILGFGMPLEHPGGGSGQPVKAPGDLSVTGTPDGNILRWKSNGNSAGTVYTIQAKANGQGAWKNLKSITRTTYRDASRPPGAYALYRVVASRGDRESVASTIVAVYPPSSMAA